MMKSAANTWAVSEHAGKTLVTSTAELELWAAGFPIPP